MDTLRHLIHLSRYVPTDGAVLQLYDLAQRGSGDRTELAAHFKNRDCFRAVYRKLKEELLKGILQPKWSLTSTHEMQVRLGQRQLESMILFRTGNTKLGIKIAEESLALALKYEQIDIALPLCRELEVIYGTIQVNTAKRNKYKKLKKHLFVSYAQETKVLEVYSELGYRVQRKKDFVDMLGTIQQLSQYLSTNHYFRFRHLYYTLCVLYYSALADSKGVETTCELAISFFEGRDNLPIYHVQWGYRFSLLNLYLHQRQFEKAEAHINMCTQLPSKGSYNWHLGMLQRCVYAFHTRQYDLVFTTYKEANTQLHKVKSKLLISRWSMIAAYLSLFQKFGLLTYPSRFRLYKYLNQEHQPFQKIHFYWLERLHLLADGKWQQLEHLLIETGQQHPILKGRTQKRVRLFNKLLGCLIKGQYHPARTTRHAQRYWDQLQNSQTDRTIHLLDQEPVPYEVLWELILGHLSVRQESKVGRK